MAQREKDWNQRYLNQDTPWEDSSPLLELSDFLKPLIKPGARVLEVGCGLGTNAAYLAKLGYKVLAIDVSKRAIKEAQDQHKMQGLSYQVHDILKDQLEGQFDLVFDKGCFHSFTDTPTRSLFVRQISDSLQDGGYWVSISGNADNPDDLEKRKADLYPRISLQSLAQAVEPYFEIQYIEQRPYAYEVQFKAWWGRFLKRKFFYQNDPIV